MLAVSSSSAVDTLSKKDEARRGAPAATVATLDRVLRGSASLAGGNGAAAETAPAGPAVGAAWGAFAVAHAEWLAARAAAGAVGPAPRDRATVLNENREVHPPVALLLTAVLPPALRLWHDEPAVDDVDVARMRPDFTVTHARDAAPSSLGALLFVEVKLPGFLHAGTYQVRAYLRRRVYALCCEADARGEAIDGVFALGAATDGERLVVVRVGSGAPAPGASYKGAVPCPAEETAPLPLLGPWDFCSPPAPPFDEREPPEGFAALARLARLPLETLGGGTPPLTTLDTVIKWAAGMGASAGAGAGAVTLTLGQRLGSGGSSDVYELLGASGRDGGGVDAAVGAVVKVARVGTTHVVKSFAAERRALEALSRAASRALVPTIVGSGTRAEHGGVGVVGGGGGGGSGGGRGGGGGGGGGGFRGWPVLLLRPRGQPLAEWVAGRVAAARARASPEAAAAAGAAEARAAASAAVAGVLDALEAAHAAGVVHCDVRPHNIVVVDDDTVPVAAPATEISEDGGARSGARVMLVDWGSSAATGADARWRGVPAFTDRRVFEPPSFRARSARDVAGALYSWLALAHDDGSGVAPWLRGMRAPDDRAMFDARDEWVGSLAGADAAVADVLALALADRGGAKARTVGALLAAARSAVATAAGSSTPSGAVHAAALTL